LEAEDHSGTLGLDYDRLDLLVAYMQNMRKHNKSHKIFPT